MTPIWIGVGLVALLAARKSPVQASGSASAGVPLNPAVAAAQAALQQQAQAAALQQQQQRQQQQQAAAAAAAAQAAKSGGGPSLNMGGGGGATPGGQGYGPSVSLGSSSLPGWLGVLDNPNTPGNQAATYDVTGALQTTPDSGLTSTIDYQTMPDYVPPEIDVSAGLAADAAGGDLSGGTIASDTSDLGFIGDPGASIDPTTADAVDAISTDGGGDYSSVDFSSF